MKTFVKYVFRKVETFFLWSSGADLSVLQQVPMEKNKFLGIGGTIIFTALMASFAGGYAFLTAFKSQWLACLFGIFWGALIYNLDRFIVSTFGSGDGKKTISRQELLEASPRLLMAILLGFVISTPLELKIFEKEIKLKVDVLKLKKKEELIKSDSTFNAEHFFIRKQLSELENKNDSMVKNKNNLIQNSVLFLETRKKELVEERNNQINNVNGAKQKRDKDLSLLNIAKSDTLGKFSSSDIVIKKSNYQNSNDSYNNEISKREEIENKILALENNKEKSLLEEQSRLESSIKSNTKDITNLKVTVAEKDSTSTGNQKNYKNVAEDYDGFAAHLEAMDALTDDKPILFYVKWLITFLFIFIEIAPILFKMMTERGPYDDIIDRMKHEYKVLQLQIQSNINQEINTAVRIHTEKYEQKLNAELQANKDVLDAISKAQKEIALVAIETWKEEQKNKMKENGTSIISSING
jgi:hypothetical protein